MRMRSWISKPIQWLAVVMVSAGLSAQYDGDAATRTRLIALENVWNTAEKARDVGALSLILDETMAYVDEEGLLLNKAEFLKSTRNSELRLQSLVTEGVSVHVFGEIAVVAGTYRVVGTLQGKSYHRIGRFIDTWIFKDGKWLCVTAQSTPVVVPRIEDAGSRAQTGSGS
jgi:ketosteroid isomerase-like protein